MDRQRKRQAETCWGKECPEQQRCMCKHAEPWADLKNGKAEMETGGVDRKVPIGKVFVVPPASKTICNHYKDLLCGSSPTTSTRKDNLFLKQQNRLRSKTMGSLLLPIGFSA